MKTRKILAAALLLSFVYIIFPTGAALAQGTDEIKEYAIEITPQSDGSLVSDYAIDWCVISDAAGPLSWITLGMPNEQYEVLGYSGDAASVNPDNSGFDYLVRIDLAREANAGDCVNINVSVRQSGMAYLDEEKGEVYYQFTPGWFNDVPVEHLKISWNLPSDQSFLKSFQPQPDSQTTALAVWETRLDAGDKFTVNLTYDRAAFPDLDSGQAASKPTAVVGATTGDSGKNSSAPYSAAPVETSQPGLFASAFSIVCICIIIIIALIILIIILRAIASSAGSYRGGGYFGGYHGSGWTGGRSSGGGSIFGSGGGSIGRSDRSGGGSGLFGGRGSSCACVSSGCACACAGGGRAGCSRKGFDVSSLFEEKEKGADEA